MQLRTFRIVLFSDSDTYRSKSGYGLRVMEVGKFNIQVCKRSSKSFLVCSSAMDCRRVDMLLKSNTFYSIFQDC
jgi:hypothetical protein